MTQSGDIDGEDAGAAIAALEAAHDTIEALLRAETVTLTRQLDRRFDEIVVLTRRVMSLEGRETLVRDLERARARRPGLLIGGRGLPSGVRQIAALRASALFDHGWYAARHRTPGRLACCWHHIRRGVYDGADPGPHFSTMEYYRANPDVAARGWPALVHYELRGRAEGRPAPSTVAPS